MAYAIAHEVGHHIQNELGLFRVIRSHPEESETENALNVRLELQADYYVGMWACYIEEQRPHETGDIEEALIAAHVGDDTLQEQLHGYLSLMGFTHGTS